MSFANMGDDFILYRYKLGELIKAKENITQIQVST